ncbi:hypothetical protein HDU99_006094 [Rhizoclosmatium hyalinum]|nr:hypothetical protein HDU99_006094 [Rhizoclosmatium hyalinum]
MHSATILLTLAAAIDAANIISDVGGDCATNVPDNVFSCKVGLVCVIKNAPPAATQINTLGGTCANPPSVLPTVVKDPSAYGNTKDFEGCVKDTTKACPLNGWSSDSVPYVCKADEKKWKSQDTTPLYVCHVDGSASSEKTETVATTRAAPATGLYSAALSVAVSTLVATAFAFVF